MSLKEKYPVRVVFRVWKDVGTVLALFPYEIETVRGECLSYEHVGQHSAANYNGCIDRTRPASPEESAPLRRELESLGYVVHEIKKKGNRK